MKHCPRCSSEISQNAKVCPRCGLAVSKMDEFAKNFSFTDEEVSGENETLIEEKEAISKREKKRIAKEEKKARKQAEKQAKKDAIKNEDTQFYKFATNSGEENPDEILDSDSYFVKRKKRKRQAAKPVFQIDKNGEFNIKTSDVEIVGEETGKIIEERYEQSYSIKKERGDYTPPKIKWWEIYKLADRHFVRRKIKKEVNKAAKVKPKFVKKSKLLLLSIFLGWIGAHSFYAKNIRKGWVSVISFLICLFVNIFASSNKFFASIQISIGGCAGFIFMLLWVSDIINICLNQYKYRIQKDRFISLLNVETRAKLGEKYIDLDLYHKPWWVRFKVWLDKTRRNYEEYKRDKRQRNIDKEKRRLEQQEEMDKIERDIANFEKQENDKLNGNLSEDYENDSNDSFVSQDTLNELKSFSDDESDDEESESVEDENIEQENNQPEKKKGAEPYSNKYAKYSNNKKSKKKKKK